MFENKTFGRKNNVVTSDVVEKKQNQVTINPIVEKKILSSNIGKVSEENEEKRKKMYKIQQYLTDELLQSVPMSELTGKNRQDVESIILTPLNDIMDNYSTKIGLDDREYIINDIINEMIGLGPLESLLARDDISDIMICGPNKIYIEVNGKIELTPIKFRDENQLINTCRRIVSAIGRRVDESSPICDARLADGSRVAIVAPPLSPDGTTLTIRKFKKDKLDLDSLIRFGSISPDAARVIQILSESRCNMLVSGGTGSGKTTLLNCITKYISPGERIITIEDAMELQLQQPHVVRWETRPPNLEGKGEVTISDLLKAALRHRPERIIIGEIRGKEAFDLLQAMNTGHDGSAGTVHSNSPIEAVSRIESMVAMGGWNLPATQVRKQIVGSLDVIVQVSRLRDGSRKVTHITEVVGLEGDVVQFQDLMKFELEGEHDGKLIGKHKMFAVRPYSIEKAKYYGLENELMKAMQGNNNG